MEAQLEANDEVKRPISLHKLWIESESADV